MNTEIVTVNLLKLQDVVRLPEGNAEVKFVKVMPKMTQITFLRETENGFFGGRMKNSTTYERFITDEEMFLIKQAAAGGYEALVRLRNLGFTDERLEAITGKTF